ncbi:MAG: hypothetical protein HZB26_25905, partial [Candidatus Hydrogenedentes bacterium]|nr:hypothetical protein [Candidatus Hydrogenedentota bacterium]
PYANQIAEWSAIYKDIWTTLEDYTEGAYYKKARLPDGAAPTSFDHPLNLEYLQVVCASTLNLHTGKAGTHGPLLGNLRKEPVARVLEKALTHEPVSMNHLYFHGELPPLRTIAEQVGRADGQEIYFSASDMRLRWLDVALQNRRRF